MTMSTDRSAKSDPVGADTTALPVAISPHDVSADPRRRLLIQAALSLPVLGWLGHAESGAGDASPASAVDPRRIRVAIERT